MTWSITAKHYIVWCSPTKAVLQVFSNNSHSWPRVFAISAACGNWLQQSSLLHCDQQSLVSYTAAGMMENLLEKKSPVLAKWNTAKPVKMNKAIEGLVDSKEWEPETSALWFRSICVADVAMELPATFLSIFTVNPIWHVCNINLSDIFSASCSYIMHEAVSCDSSHLFHVHTDWHQRHNGSSHWVVWNGSYIWYGTSFHFLLNYQSIQTLKQLWIYSLLFIIS